MSESPDHAVRLVMRCADVLVPPGPGSVRDQCGRCGHQVFVDTLQPVPAAARGLVTELVCIRCALADPFLRPKVIAVRQQVQGVTAVLRRAEEERQAQRARRRKGMPR